QAVIGRVEDVMQGNGQLHDTKAGTKVAPGLSDAIKQIGAQLVSKLRQLLFRQQAQLGRRVDPVQQGRIGTVSRKFLEYVSLIHPLYRTLGKNCAIICDVDGMGTAEATPRDRGSDFPIASV